MKIRLDQILVERNSCQTRSQAALLIKDGKVKVKGKQVFKPGSKFESNVKVGIESTDQYVGRGAKKLKAAIQKFQVIPEGLVIADIGASTGGFTDYLLQNGALKAYCIDVGHDQLAEKLKQDPRVINLERTNIRDLKELPEKIDLAVIDLSYISLRKVLHVICTYFEGEGDIIALFKPQFECGPKVVNKQGVITDNIVREKVLEDFLTWIESEDQMNVVEQMESPIQGKHGNIEYLLWIKVTHTVSG